MEAWKSVVALAVAGVFATGTAWAQTSTPSPADKTDKSATGTMDKSGDKSATGTMDKSGDKSATMGKAGKMDKSAKGGNREQVKAVQQALKDKGHDPGDVDGVMGAKTKSALKDFQKAQGIKESGSLDNETMTKLGVDMKSGAAGSSSPAASPATDKSAQPSASSTDKPTQPSASPSTGASKPADSTKPTEEKKK